MTKLIPTPRKKIKKAFFLIFCIFIISLAVRIYHLDDLPGEWYGDISIVHAHVEAILSGKWPFKFILSAGPLYHYLIAPIIAIFGFNYLSYKLASVAVSLAGLAVMMVIAYQIDGTKLSLLTGLVASISSWLLVFSRLGNSQIIIPLLTGLMAYFLVRWLKSSQQRDVILAAIMSSLGLYAYPQTFILPGVFLVIVFFYMLVRRELSFKLLLISSAAIFFLSLPFLIIIRSNSANFTSGYIGSKLFGTSNIDSHFVTGFFTNLYKTALMLHVKGDVVFRSNPPHMPHLDSISGVLFFFGIILFFGRKYRRFRPSFILLLVLLVIPSSWPYLPAAEIPSASRTIGIVPFVYLLVAGGLIAFYRLLKIRLGADKMVASVVIAVLFGIITFFNLRRYFVSYAYNLPNHNTPFGRIIANWINQLPSDTQVFILGCCWGEWGQPEPDGIRYAVAKQLRDRIRFLPEAAPCEGIERKKRVVIIFNPENKRLKGELSACLGRKPHLITVNGQDVFGYLGQGFPLLPP